MTDARADEIRDIIQEITDFIDQLTLKHEYFDMKLVKLNIDKNDESSDDEKITVLDLFVNDCGKRSKTYNFSGDFVADDSTLKEASDENATTSYTSTTATGSNSNSEITQDSISSATKKSKKTKYQIAHGKNKTVENISNPKVNQQRTIININRRKNLSKNVKKGNDEKTPRTNTDSTSNDTTKTSNVKSAGTNTVINKENNESSKATRANSEKKNIQSFTANSQAFLKTNTKKASKINSNAVSESNTRSLSEIDTDTVSRTNNQALLGTNTQFNSATTSQAVPTKNVASANVDQTTEFFHNSNQANIASTQSNYPSKETVNNANIISDEKTSSETNNNTKINYDSTSETTSVNSVENIYDEENIETNYNSDEFDITDNESLEEKLLQSLRELIRSEVNIAAGASDQRTEMNIAKSGYGTISDKNVNEDFYDDKCASESQPQFQKIELIDNVLLWKKQMDGKGRNEPLLVHLVDYNGQRQITIY